MPSPRYCRRCRRSIPETEMGFKCCPSHTSQNGDDVMCQRCATELHPEQAAEFAQPPTPEPTRVPLVIYEDGERKIIGDAQVSPDGSVFSANVTDPEMVSRLGGRVANLSFQPKGPNGPEAVEDQSVLGRIARDLSETHIHSVSIDKTGAPHPEVHEVKRRNVFDQDKAE